MCAAAQDLAAQLAALGGGDAAGDTHTLAEENAALRGAHAELEAKVPQIILYVHRKPLTHHFVVEERKTLVHNDSLQVISWFHGC